MTATSHVKGSGKGYTSRIPGDVRKLYARKARESFRTREVKPFRDKGE